MAAPGRLIVNADDWGLDAATTDAIRRCIRQGVVESTSAMVFMADSQRAAGLARADEIDCGLHLNFTEAFTATDLPPGLAADHARVAAYLRRSPLCRYVPHPGLAAAFRRLVDAQLAEYHRLYFRAPARIDGHHHMHLCANVLVAGLLPTGVVIRRNFTFAAREKGIVNRTVRALQDRWLARRYRIRDFLFNLHPIEPVDRLAAIVALSRDAAVELEVHPGRPEESTFLRSGALASLIDTR